MKNHAFKIAAMVKVTFMSISFFLLLKTVSGNVTPGETSLIYTPEIFDPVSGTTLIIEIQPVDQTDCKGNKVTFSVIVRGGTGPVHYLWKRKRLTDAGFSAFGARDSMKLPVYNIGTGNEAPDGTFYQVIVSDQNSSVISVAAKLTVNTIAGIAPVGVANYTVNQGDHLWFKVLTSGNSPLAYQWIKKFGLSDWRNLSDNTTVTGSQREQLNFDGIAVADSGTYKVRVTFPTVNDNQCVETSAISRKITVIPAPDNDPPVFINLSDEYKIFCPTDLGLAAWSDSIADILPVRSDFYRFQKQQTLFDLSPTHFYDEVTPSEELILHWGIFLANDPFGPVKDEAGTLLEDQTGQMSLHPENIRFAAGNPGCRIIFWLEDAAGNLTPDELRHRIVVSVVPRPDISSDF